MNKQMIIKNILENLSISTPFTIVEDKTIVQNVFDILNSYVLDNLNNFDLNRLDIEGESKKLYRDIKSDICLIKLKPTMYSFTHNRYGTVKGTDLLRNKLWKVFSDEINTESVNVLFNGVGSHSVEVHNMINNLIKSGRLSKEYPFLTSFLSQVNIEGQIYNVCKYIENQTPLEVVWKKYFLGTMKHNLLNVDQYMTKTGQFIQIEGEMPEIVRFDWRNPFEYENIRYKDECIPDDFASFWIDVNNAKTLCKVVSNIISEMVGKKGYTFVDTCYFINATGNIVYSEITPDGMRLKKNDDSFDKDLWRLGKEEEVICKAWTDLYNDLTM